MATKGRTPIPKSQKEISVSKQVPYDITRGNPNDIVDDKRGNVLSLKDDKVKPFTIGIQDIDESIMYYFKNIIKPSVIQNGERVEVPIIYGSPERWKSVQKDGYYRDAGGKMMMPILMFKRGSIEKVRNVTNKVDANNPHNFEVYRKSYSNKNTYDNFNILTNVKPEITNHIVVVPDYINITYNCVISTYYMDQLNKIIEAVEYASDAYWGDKTRFQFKAMIDSFDTITELTDSVERTVKCNFAIKLNGYIIPDTLQKDLNSIKKYNTPTKISISINESENI